MTQHTTQKLKEAPQSMPSLLSPPPLTHRVSTICQTLQPAPVSRNRHCHQPQRQGHIISGQHRSCQHRDTCPNAAAAADCRSAGHKRAASPARPQLPLLPLRCCRRSFAAAATACRCCAGGGGGSSSSSGSSGSGDSRSSSSSKPGSGISSGGSSSGSGSGSGGSVRVEVTDAAGDHGRGAARREVREAVHELLRDGQLHELVVVAAGAREGDVHLARLGRGEGRLERRRAEVALEAVRLVDGDARHGDAHLHLDALAVDGLHAADALVHKHLGLAAAVDADALALALDVQRRVHTPVHVHAVLGVGHLHRHHARVLALVLHDPLVARLHELQLGGPLGLIGSGLGSGGGGRCLGSGRRRGGSVAALVLCAPRLLVLGHLLRLEVGLRSELGLELGLVGLRFGVRVRVRERRRPCTPRATSAGPRSPVEVDGRTASSSGNGDVPQAAQ
eukprot:TRINITY_DN5331_c0_g1_i2.p1 TRINITY_DN5331_c0_g1~~TRINITY_DN5331_c0_g1_i2.p1  ORF type:complete len:448 (-),score=46.40 TRINITY_DN5331_c0_g1_i2:607-1950(-)